MYEIKNNEIAFAAAVENFNRAFRVGGVINENSFKVLERANLEVHLPNASTGFLENLKHIWNSNVQDDFEAGVGAWSFAGDTTLSVEGVIVQEGTQSMKMVWAHDGVTQFDNRITLPYSDEDIKYRNKLRFQFYPAVTLEDNLLIKYKNNGSEFTLTTIAPGSVTAGQWNEVEVDLPASDGQKNVFQELIFEYDGLNWTGVSHTFYFDLIEFDTHVTVDTAPAATFNRRDLIYLNTSGKAVYLAGTAQDTDPVEPPDLPVNAICLAIIEVNESVTSIPQAKIFDTRVQNTMVEESFGVSGDISALELESLQHELEIIELQANVLETPVDHDTLISDTFSDSNGYGDTVNLGLTTAIYDAGAKKYAASVVVSRASNNTYVDTGLSTVKFGFNILIGASNIDIVSVTKAVVSTATTAYIYSGDTLLGSATFSGLVATFASVVTLTAATNYRVVGDNNGGNYVAGEDGSGTYPNYTEFDYVERVSGQPAAWNTSGVDAFLVQSIELLASGPDLVTDIPTITGTVTDIMVIANTPDREAGDDVTFDITDGVTTLTDQILGSKIAWTGGSNPDQLTINLVAAPSPTAGVPSCKTYATKFWKV